MYNWYPINFYDAREGENRDNMRAATDDSCTTNGVMNAVEIDVGNLKRWLANSSGKRPKCELSRAEWLRAVFLGSPGHVV